jgi:hypothetical protein
MAISHAFKLDKAVRSRLDELRDTFVDLGVTVESITSELDTDREEHQDAFEEKSEGWQEGDRGVAVAEWISLVEGLHTDLEELGTALDQLVATIDELPNKPGE